MEWLGWAFAAATALLLTIFIFLYLHQKQQAQHQHKKSQKALGKLENEMNRMQKELHHERDIIGLIQEHMVEGILILDDSDKIQLANRTATALLNISKESWDNKSIFILTDNQDFLDALRKSKTAPQHELLPEDSELHKGCSVRQLLKIDGKYIRAYITRVEMGGIFGTIVLLVDVTYNVKAEKMRQEFTANVSHELKTPITSVKVLADSLLAQHQRGRRCQVRCHDRTGKRTPAVSHQRHYPPVGDRGTHGNAEHTGGTGSCGKERPANSGAADSTEQNSRPAGGRLSAAPQQRGLHTGIVHQPH